MATLPEIQTPAVEEIWEPIDGAPNYQVSNLGRVRNVSTGLVRKQNTHTHGYLAVSLGAQRREYVHRLVCAAFNGPCPVGHQCDHINRVRTDNRAENLRWITPEENKAHRVHPQGEQKAQAKLSAIEVAKIRALLPTMSNTEIAMKFGVHRRTIADIRNGVTWK